MSSIVKMTEYLQTVQSKIPEYINIINANTPDYITVTYPSIDRPFGIHLWPFFNEVVSTITNGRFVPDEFEYIEGVNYMSTNQEVFFMILGYYFIISFGQYVFKSLKPLKLNFLFQLHNLTLTAISGTLLICLFEQVLPIVYNHGVLYSICSPSAWHQKVVTIYYLNYLTKYLEFVDTLFLVVKKKPIIFLHSYHHGATALLCFIQLNGHTSVSWVPILLNLGVHVIMYWYYFLASRGIKVWWKQWITRFQILQFVLDLYCVYLSTYTFYAYRWSEFYNISIPNLGTCHGTQFAAGVGCAILTSYLILFIGFYIKVYKKKPAKSGKASKAYKAAKASEAAKASKTDKSMAKAQ